MEMFRLGTVGGDFVDIEVDGDLRSDTESPNPGFLQGLPAGDTEHILVSVAVAAELKPAVELAMVMKHDARAIGIDNEGTAGEVGGE